MASGDMVNRPNGKLYHNAALAFLIACPLVALLPPRRLGLGTAGLGVSWFLSANYLVQERRQRSPIIAPTMSETTLPSPEAGSERGHKESLIQFPMAKTSNLQRNKRLEEYQDKLDEGAGYGDIIKEQIWDVWNQDKGGRKD